MARKVPEVNRPSVLLTPEENDLVFSLIGPRCTSLATAVVQLFITDGPTHNEWIQLDTGVLCFIKNNIQKAYFFGIYCLERKMLIWEHEVYDQIQYQVPKTFFHTFEAQEYMTAFNFANEEEASTFEACFQAKTNKEIRKLERLERAIQRSESRREVKTPQINQQVKEKTDVQIEERTYNGTRKPTPAEINYGTTKLKKRTKLTKAEIGDPHNFQHVYGPSKIAGWSSNNETDIDGLLAKVDKDFLAQAGVSETQLRDKRTRSFIASFITENGGVDAVTEEIKQKDNQFNSTKENAVWSTVMSYATGGRRKTKARKNTDVGIGVPRPMIPVTIDYSETKKKVDDNLAKLTPLAPPVPPTPPTRAAPARPQPPRQPPQPAGGPPPPPPPPPPPGPMFSPLAQQPPNYTAAAGNIDNKADLFKSIRNRQTLKRVETTLEDSDKPQEEKGDLLQEIRKGINLKTVPVTGERKELKQFADGSLANALAVALEERSKLMYSDNSSSDQEASSDGENWE